MVKPTGAPEMLQGHRGDDLAGLFLLMVLVLTTNISNICLFFSFFIILLVFFIISNIFLNMTEV